MSDEHIPGVFPIHGGTRWAASVRLGTRRDGRPNRVTRTAKTKEEAVEKLAEIKRLNKRSVRDTAGRRGD